MTSRGLAEGLDDHDSPRAHRYQGAGLVDGPEYEQLGGWEGGGAFIRNIIPFRRPAAARPCLGGFRELKGKG